MKSQPPKLEIALQLSAEQCRRLTARVRAKAFASGAIERNTFKEVYFDTADRALRTAGLSLCLRVCDGSWEQQLRAIEDGGGLPSRRIE